MSKFLGTVYPVSPCQSLEIFCLDCLDIDKKAYDYLDTYLNYYNEGKRRGRCDGEIVHYNNSLLYIGEADDIFDFATNFRTALFNVRKEQ